MMQRIKPPNQFTSTVNKIT